MSIYLTYPKVFLFILIPLIILAFLIITNKNGFEVHFSKKALKKLQTTNGKSIKTRNIYLFISLIFFVMALSQPIFINDQNSFELYRLFIIIGIISSMFGFYSFPKVKGKLW